MMKRLLLATSVLALTASGAFAQSSYPSPAQSPAMPSPQSATPSSENNMAPAQEEKTDHATGQNHGTGTEQTGQMPSSGATGSSSNGQPAPMADTGHMSQVKQAQQTLKDDGLYKGKVDGKMGPQTKSALSQFQKQNGLKQTAQLDHATIKALTQGGSLGGSSMGGSSGGSMGGASGGGAMGGAGAGSMGGSDMPPGGGSSK